jgi:hypothetical protein
MKAKNTHVIKQYVSNLDNDLVLVLVSVRSATYTVEIMGEEFTEFQSEAEAIRYAELMLKNFYE